MYELKKNIGKVFTSKFVGTGHSSYEKKNLPGRGLTKVEKHCHTAYTTVSLRMNPKRFETCGRQLKLNIELENCAFVWYVLYHYITMHGAKNAKLPVIYVS